MKKVYCLGIIWCYCLALLAQDYDTYFIGNMADATPSPQGGVCLMGGATEDDNAMRWFLNRASGGDILVLRASQSDGYNNYFYSELGVSVNSVETIVFNNANAATDAYVLSRIERAEAIWFAGGDQSRYVEYWRGTSVDAAINTAIADRNIVIGGTSAGMAILGGAYFTAEEDTVLSDEALGDPYDNRVTVSNEPFLAIPGLEQVVTDMHYDDPSREGRHMTFLARAMTDFGSTFYGIACDEYTAVCIDESGQAQVFGAYPDYDDNAYFLVPNCSIPNNVPEQCVAGQPLTWDRNGVALTVYAVKGTPTGLYTFDTNTWETGTGGEWQYWAVNAGVLDRTMGTQPDCNMVMSTTTSAAAALVKIYPNPADDHVRIESTEASVTYRLLDLQGRLIHTFQSAHLNYDLNVQNVPSGTYLLEWSIGHEQASRRLLIR